MKTQLILPDGTTTTMESVGFLEDYIKWLDGIVIADIPPAMKQRILFEWFATTYQTVKQHIKDQAEFKENRAANNTQFMIAMRTVDPMGR